MEWRQLTAARIWIPCRPNHECFVQLACAVKHLISCNPDGADVEVVSYVARRTALPAKSGSTGNLSEYWLGSTPIPLRKFPAEALELILCRILENLLGYLGSLAVLVWL